MYTRYGVACHGTGSWKFGNDFTRNNIMFGVDKSSSSLVDNCKNNFLVLGEGMLMILMAALGQQSKSLVLILVKQIQNFARVCITIMTSYLFDNEKEMWRICLKLIIKMPTF